MDSKPNSAVSVLHYRERLRPSAALWCAVPVATGLVFLAVRPIGLLAAVVSCLVATLGLVLWGALGSPVLEVRGQTLRAGRAQVPVSWLGAVTWAEGEQARAERGPRLDARAFLVVVGWVDPVLRVALTDPQDPTPYWLLSTRKPQELAAAVAAAKATATA